MKLPYMPNNVRKYNRSVISLGDICFTEYTEPGAVYDSFGITSDEAPYIKTVNARSALSEHSDVYDIAEWNGLVVLKDGNVYYGGEAIGNITPGKKQFAVVNTKMCIFPDKVYIDLTEKKTGTLYASVKSVEGGASVSGLNTLTLAAESKLDDFTATGKTKRVNYTPVETTWVNAYDSVEIVGGEVIKSGKHAIPMNRLKAGDIIIPGEADDGAYTVNTASGVWCYDEYDYEQIPEDERPVISDAGELTDGRYAKVVSVTESGSAWAEYLTVTVKTEIYKQGEAAKLTDKFKVGDVVSVTDSTGTVIDKLPILALTDTEITFKDEAFQKDGALGGVAAVSRDVPDLDFICESGNRLWGCSGNTIYASALGDPTNFYFYDVGQSTASWSVAVGTEDPFTGCAKYGSSVLFFKEKRIHKVLGSYPEEFSVYDSYAEGVKAGCERSIITINNVLFYYGLHGVYAYTGATPSLISPNFGNKKFTDAVGGSDGRKYFFSAKDSDKEYYMTYDTKTGLWVKEADRFADRFVLVGTELMYLEGGTVYIADSGNADGSVSWLIKFAPFNDIRNSITMYLHKVQYIRLIFHVKLSDGAFIDVYTDSDGAGEKFAGHIGGSYGDYVQEVVLPVNRVENYAVILRGFGPCVIKAVTREFQERSYK